MLSHSAKSVLERQSLREQNRSPQSADYKTSLPKVKPHSVSRCLWFGKGCVQFGPSASEAFLPFGSAPIILECMYGPLVYDREIGWVPAGSVDAVQS